MIVSGKSHGRKSISANLKPRDLMKTQGLVSPVWTAEIITLLPDSFPGILGYSLTGRALLNGKWALRTVDLRCFGKGKHKSVDDTPAGGGAGMVLRADVVGKAIDHTLKNQRVRKPLICLTPRGRLFDQSIAQKWADGPGVIMLAGRFEGIDQRVIDHYCMEEISLGDFVMSGGEIAAQAMIDACVRLLPNVLGNNGSIQEESHNGGLLEYPQYTRPGEWKGHRVPGVLRSGDHKKISAWRDAEAHLTTMDRRPDMWKKKNKFD